MGRSRVSISFAIFALLACFSTAFCAGHQVRDEGPRVNGMPEYWTWIGRETIVWGNVHWGDRESGTYTIDFGDDSPPATGTVTDVKFISATHTYAITGDVRATLTVTDDDGLSDQEQIRIHVGANPEDMADNGFTYEHNAALEDGLRWLYLHQDPCGYWGEYQGTRFPVGETAIALLAFEEHGHRPSNDHDEDIYAEYVELGLRYLFQHVRTQTLSPQTYIGNPDTDGDNLGVYFASEDDYCSMYETPLALMAIVETRTPETVVSEGACAGSTYYQVAVDCCDYIAWGQTEDGVYRGGWRYHANYSAAPPRSDNSVSQWPALALMAASRIWEIEADPEVVAELMDHWLAQSQDVSGGFRYYPGHYRVAVAVTAGGLCCLDYCGVANDDSRFQGALEYLNANWFATGGWDYQHFGNEYAMYGVAKALWLANPPVHFVGSHDWWAEYCEWLVTDQSSDGSWSYPGPGGTSRVCGTGWAVSILNGALISPIACIRDVPRRVVSGVPFYVDGTCSHQPDTRYHIVSYKWDWGTDGPPDWDNPDAEGAVVTDVVYNLPAGFDSMQYTITLRVEDDHVPPLWDTEAMRITVVADSCTQMPPVADPGGPYSGYPGETIMVDGTASYDPNEPCGDYVAYWDWDLDGHGDFGDCTDSVCTLTLPLHETTWNIGLIVCDSENLCSTPTGTWVKVVSGARDVYVASVNSSRRYADVGDTVLITATVCCDDSSDYAVDDLLVSFYMGHPDTGGYSMLDSIISHLEVGECKQVSFKFVMPDTLDHRVCVFADPLDEVLEFNEHNNIGCTIVHWASCVIAATGEVTMEDGHITVPIVVSDVTGREVRSADLTFTFDPAIMEPAGMNLDGTLVEGTDWMFMYNDPVPGKVLVSLAGTDALSGAGVLVNLEFDVTASAPCGGCTPLELGLLLNEGEPCVVVPDTAAYCLPMETIAGCVHYYGCPYLGNTEPPVPGVTVFLEGATLDTAVTDEAGCYELDACLDSCYIITPTKQGDGGAITSLDAALIMRYMVCLESLKYCPIVPMEMYDSTYCPADTVYPQRVVADVSGSGMITSFDASIILRYVVGMDVSEYLVGEWRFYCDSISVCPLSGSIDGQDFVAVLYGDVSGNWGGPTPASGGSEAVIAIENVVGSPGDLVHVPVYIHNGDGFYGLDFKVAHDAGVVTVESVELGDIADGCLMEYDVKPGMVHIAMASSQGFVGDGVVCVITYRVAEDPGVSSTAFRIRQARADEYVDYLVAQDGKLLLESAGTKPTVPVAFALYPVEPNPVSGMALLRFDVGELSHVRLTIHDVRGRLVRGLVDEIKTPNSYAILWDATDERGNPLPTGVYFVRLEAGSHIANSKVIITR